MKIQVDLPEEINRAVKVHKLRYHFNKLQDAVIDALERFFSEDDSEYFFKENEKIKTKRKDNPSYIKKVEEGKK